MTKRTRHDYQFRPDSEAQLVRSPEDLVPAVLPGAFGRLWPARRMRFLPCARISVAPSPASSEEVCSCC